MEYLGNMGETNMPKIRNGVGGIRTQNPPAPPPKWET